MHNLFDLQIFNDDPVPAPAGGDGGNDPKPAGGDGKKAEPKPATNKELKYTDDDLDQILGKRFARWEKEKQKAIDEASKLANMDAQQRAEHERDKLQKELDALKRKDALSEMTKTARGMLSAEGITVPDALLSMMVNTDAEETKAAVDGFAKCFVEAVEKAVKERLKGETPRKGNGGGAAPMTKAEIMAIKDPELRQKKMLEHKELFNF